MNKILIGLTFTFFYFDLTIDGHIVGLIPGFLGYFLVWMGLKEVEYENPWFKKIQLITLIMAVLNLGEYIVKLINFNLSGQVFAFFALMLSLVGCLVSIFIMYGITKGFQGMEVTLNKELNSDNLYMAWKFSAFLGPIATVLIVVPAIALVAMVCSTIAHVFFLIFLYTSNNLYKDDKPADSLRL